MCGFVLQEDLQKLLYPVFVHCYLRLVRQSTVAEAQQMLAKHHSRFLATTKHRAETRQLVRLEQLAAAGS